MCTSCLNAEDGKYFCSFCVYCTQHYLYWFKPGGVETTDIYCKECIDAVEKIFKDKGIPSDGMKAYQRIGPDFIARNAVESLQTDDDDDDDDLDLVQIEREAIYLWDYPSVLEEVDWGSD